jgi:release factor glutamine methyltransferase
MLDTLPHPCHLIVANLPYIPCRELEGLSPEVAAFEPKVALDGGDDGLGPLRRFVAQVGPKTHPGGSFLLEIGQGQGEAASKLARESFPRAQVTLLPDLAGIERALVVCFS